MSNITDFDLCSGRPFNYEHYTLVPPLLETIRNKDLCGYATYLSYIYPFCIDKEQLLENMGFLEWYEKELNPQEKQDLTVFKILLMSNPQMLLKAIQFFIEEEVVLDEEKGCFALYKTIQVKKKTKKELVGYIDNDNFYSLCGAICKLNYREQPEGEEDISQYTFRSENAKMLYLEMLQERKKFNKIKARSQSKANGEQYEMANVISSVCAKHNSYNYTNIYELTVYQLYDQFYKMIKNNQVDTYAQKWAAWGTKDFDFTTWYSK